MSKYLLPTEDLFNSFFDSFNHWESNVLKTDIHETKGAYEFNIDMPGFKKDDIKISLDKGYLTINATRNEKEDADEDKTYLRKERYYGEVTRSYYLGDNVRFDDIDASFENGVLKLVINKKNEETTTSKLIDIR